MWEEKGGTILQTFKPKLSEGHADSDIWLRWYMLVETMWFLTKVFVR